MQIIHPHSDSWIRKRNVLLQECLRPDVDSIPIELEYPTVLSPEHPQHSFCLVHQDQVLAHLNYWPRLQVSQDQTQTLPIALVGNVASDPKVRGRGFVRTLFEHIFEIATAADITQIFLWSDLHSFYQKLGFKALGQELRIPFELSSLQGQLSKSASVHYLSPIELNTPILGRLLELRYPIGNSIQRSLPEFRALLNIPNTLLFTIHGDKGRIDGFAIVGRGMDMLGVIHEWGCSDPLLMLGLIEEIVRRLACQQIVLLAPEKLELDAPMQVLLKARTGQIQRHPMALVWRHPDRGAEAPLPFIWGLDSI